MKVVIDTHGHLLVLDPKNGVGAVLAELAGAELHKLNGFSDTSTYVRAGTKERPVSLDLQIVDESRFEAPSPAIEDMAKSLQEAEHRWVEYYTKYNATKKELDALKEQLAAMSHVPTEKPKA
jgi:hypothetical protein